MRGAATHRLAGRRPDFAVLRMTLFAYEEAHEKVSASAAGRAQTRRRLDENTVADPQESLGTARRTRAPGQEEGRLVRRGSAGRACRGRDGF